MENSNQTGAAVEAGGLASAAMEAGKALLQDLLMTAANSSAGATTELPLLSGDTLASQAQSQQLDHLNAPAPGRPHDPAAINDLPCFKDLIAVLIECFTIILLGYLSSRFKLVSSEARDLGAYLTTFALPMIIFLNIAQMEFQTINMSFLFCMLISKLLLFILVTLITLAISYPANFSYAGALAILATQSNDFALGYPLMKSLYGESRPEMLSYLNLMGPIQLLIINPLGIVMLEFEKARCERRRRLAAARASLQANPKSCRQRHCSDSHSNSGNQTPPAQVDQQVNKTDGAFISRHSAGARQRASNRPPGGNELRQISASLVNLAPDKEGQAAVRNACELGGKAAGSPSGGGGSNANLEDDTSRPPGDAGQQKMSLTMAARASGLRRKNIKSLTLVMPATIMPRLSSSAESLAPSAAYNNGAELALAADCCKASGRPQQVACSQTQAQAAAPLEQRSVYTRPKLIDFIASSKWLARSPGAASHSAGARGAQAPVSTDDSTQMQNVLGEEQRGAPQCFADTSSSATSAAGFDETLHSNDDDEADAADEAARAKASLAAEPKIDLGFIRALLTNPLIIASVVALAVNLINGPELPKFVTKVSNTIAASFAAPALFVVGLSMYGKFKLVVKNPNDFLLSSVLVATKVLVLPSIMRTIVMLILPHYAAPAEVPHLADFSYLYGLLPTAPGACIIAKQYEVLTNVVSICMLLSTLISAPLMLATSAVINQAASVRPEEVLSMVAQTLRGSSGLTLVLSLLTLYLLWRSNRRVSYLAFMESIERILNGATNRARATHLFTLLLALTQLVISIGGIMWLFVDTAKLRPAGHHQALALGVGDGARPPLDEQLVAAASGLQASWTQHDDDELLASEERHTLHNRILTPGPHGFYVAQQAAAGALMPRDDLGGFGALCSMQYIISSGGLLMARFIILCIVLTNFARRHEGHRLGALVCSLLMKVYPLVGVAIILTLVFESQHLSCAPSEASLPTWPVAIYTRLAFNATLLCLAIPLFTATFRLANRAVWLKARADDETGAPGDDDPAAALRRQRRFKQSSSSLSSETSSAITTSTNLESSLNQQQQQQLLCGPNPARASAAHRPALEQLAQQQAEKSAGRNLQQQQLQRQQDGGDVELQRQQQVKHVNEDDSSATRRQHSSDPQRALAASDIVDGLYQANNPATNGSNWRVQQLKRSSNTTTSATSIDNPHYVISDLDNAPHHRQANGLEHSHELIRPNGPDKLPLQASDDKPASYEPSLARAEADSPASDPGGQQQQRQQQQWPPKCCGEFDKFSFLIVFMLFQALLNVTSMVQQLSQASPYGTFVLIEIANVALDFGQGLVTFLVIGLQVVPFRELFCSSTNVFVSADADTRGPSVVRRIV